MKKLLCVLTLILCFCFAFSPLTFASAEEISNAQVDKFEIKYDKEKAVMLGGNDFTLELSGASGDVVWSVQNPNLCALSGNNTGVTISPLSSGVAIITANCNGEKALAEINIIDIANLSQVDITWGETAMAHTDIEIAFSAGGYQSFYNFSGEWQVIDSAGNNLPFEDNGESILIKKDYANNGKYKVELVSSGFAPINKTLEIIEYDIDGLIKKWLPIITIVVIIILVLIIVSKIKGTKLGKVQKSLKKVISKVQQLKTKADSTVNTLFVVNKLININIQLKNIANNVQLLNMDNYGYYQVLQDMLVNACNGIDAFLLSQKKNEVAFLTALLDKYLIPALEKSDALIEIEKHPTKKVLSEIDEINYNAESQRKNSIFNRSFNSIIDSDSDDDDE